MRTLKRIALAAVFVVLIVTGIGIALPGRRLEVAADGNLAKNAGFEQWDGVRPSAWELQKKIAGNGTAQPDGKAHFDEPIAAGIETGRFRPTRARAWVLTAAAIDSNTGTLPFTAPGIHWAKHASDGERGRFPARSVVSLEIDGR